MKLLLPPLTQRGFSLMELMIALGIFGILSAIAVPSYLDHVRKTRRTEAHTAITTLVTLQERYFSDYGSYTAELVTRPNIEACEDDGDDPGLGYFATTPDGNYNLSVRLTLAPPPAAAPPLPTWDLVDCRITANQANVFRITATATGAQAGDSRCPTIWRDSSGATGPSAACWNR